MAAIVIFIEPLFAQFPTNSTLALLAKKVAIQADVRENELLTLKIFLHSGFRPLELWKVSAGLLQ
jgi:hypothetical protein